MADKPVALMHDNVLVGTFDDELNLHRVLLPIFFTPPFLWYDTRTVIPWAELFNKFLEERLVPRSRGDIRRILDLMGLAEYDAVAILRFTGAQLIEDGFWVCFEEECDCSTTLRGRYGIAHPGRTAEEVQRAGREMRAAASKAVGI